ncbi:DNA polymerase beta superfamily protein [Nostoc sp.]|uniref:DNA polymerase beta superfamily protein n=1 Tax=Nostoc sp. TaxID=1180 RepID=UPI002FF6D504
MLPLLYVYRVLLTGIYLMQTGVVEANLIKLNEVFNLPYIHDLIAQKLVGKEKSILSDVNVDFHRREYERLRNKLQEAYESSQLPEVPSANVALHNLLVRLRGRSDEY